MGRKTFESIGKPLPNRKNFVLSRNLKKIEIALTPLESRNDTKREIQTVIARDLPSFGRDRSNPQTQTIKVFTSFDEAIKKISTPNAYIIGGAEIFKQTMDKIGGIYLTQIDADYEGDTFYPEIPDYFKEKSRTPLQDNPKIEVIFYESRSPSPF